MPAGTSTLLSPTIVLLTRRLQALWLRPQWHTEQEHLPQPPHMVGEPRGHGRRRGPPVFGRARPVRWQGLWQRLPQTGMRQTKVVIGLVELKLRSYFQPLQRR
jgi:hypothetical protein